MFDTTKFNNARFETRTKSIEVPLLKDFFQDGEDVVWNIRALSSEDLAIANLAKEKNQNIGQILVAMMGGVAKDKAEAVKEMVGINDNLPDDIVKRIEILLLGSVDLDATDPQSRETVIKLSQFYPGTFMRLTNAIYELSGEGPQVAGKP